MSAVNLDAKGRYSDAEVAAVANLFGVWPQSQADVDRIMNTLGGSILVLRLRARAVARELLAPLQGLHDHRPRIFWAIFWAAAAAVAAIIILGAVLH